MDMNREDRVIVKECMDEIFNLMKDLHNDNMIPTRAGVDMVANRLDTINSTLGDREEQLINQVKALKDNEIREYQHGDGDEAHMYCVKILNQVIALIGGEEEV